MKASFCDGAILQSKLYGDDRMCFSSVLSFHQTSPDEIGLLHTILPRRHPRSVHFPRLSSVLISTNQPTAEEGVREGDRPSHPRAGRLEDASRPTRRESETHLPLLLKTEEAQPLVHDAVIA